MTVPVPGEGHVRLGAKPINSIIQVDIEHVQRAWQKRSPRGKGGAVGANRAIARLRHLFNWAVRKGYVAETPFRRGGVAVISFNTRAETPRERRLTADEEQRLLEHAATQRMKDLIIAALETGCRRGELLSMQFSQVHWKQDVIILPAEKTKTRRARSIPITKQLREVLERRQKGPDGRTLGPGCYVFGTSTGEQITSLQEAWERTCDAAKIEGLHFHDLRREFGSRLLESGANWHQVRDWLGHANITMTSRYLATTAAGLQKARERFETFRQTASNN